MRENWGFSHLNEGDNKLMLDYESIDKKTIDWAAVN